METTTDKRKRLPKFRRDPEGFGGLRLTSRDLEILRLVHDYRYVLVDHVLALVPGNRRQLEYRLQGLFHHKYLQRLLPPLAMRVGDDRSPSGSVKVTYGLDIEGASALARAEGISTDELAWEPRHSERMQWFIEHRLMLSTFRAAIEVALRGRSDLELVEWRDEAEIRDTVTVQYSDGKKRQHRVAPDAYFAVREHGKLRHFLVEIDRGSEEHARLLPKFSGLWWYCAPESPFYRKFQDAKDVLILFVGTSEPRLEAMRRTLAKVDEKQRGLRRFWFTTDHRYRLGKPESVIGGIWDVGPVVRTSGTTESPETRRALFG
jgi:hypothetical protein